MKMRFMVTGELNRNRLIQTIVVLYSFFVIGLWVTNVMLYFGKMGLTYSSVVAYYLGSPERFLEPRSFQGLAEVSHYHFFAMGMILVMLTHLVIFAQVSERTKIVLIVLPFFSAFLDEGSGWGIVYLHPGFAFLKIAGFLLLQSSLAALVGISLWSVFTGTTESYKRGEGLGNSTGSEP